MTFIKSNNLFYGAIERYFAQEFAHSVSAEYYEDVHNGFDELKTFLSGVVAGNYAFDVLEISYFDSTKEDEKSFGVFVVLAELKDAVYSSFEIPKEAKREAYFEFENRASALALVSEFQDYVDSACSDAEK